MSLTHVLCADMKADVVQEKPKLFMYAGDRVSLLVMSWKLDLNDDGCHTACSSTDGHSRDRCFQAMYATRSAFSCFEPTGSQPYIRMSAWWNLGTGTSSCGDNTDVTGVPLGIPILDDSITASSKDSSICVDAQMLQALLQLTKAIQHSTLQVDTPSAQQTLRHMHQGDSLRSERP